VGFWPGTNISGNSSSARQNANSNSQNYFSTIKESNAKIPLKNLFQSSRNTNEAQIAALRKVVIQKTILRERKRKERINSIKTQIYCNIAHTSEKYLGKMPNIWAGMLMLSQNLLWGGKMNSFEKEKQKEEAIWKSIEGKYPAKVIKDTRLYMDILDYYWYKAACAPTIEETKKILDELDKIDSDIVLGKKNRTGLVLEDVMDGYGHIIREFDGEINKRIGRRGLGQGQFGTPERKAHAYLFRALGTRNPYFQWVSKEHEDNFHEYTEPDNVKDAEAYKKNVMDAFEFMKKYVQKAYGGEP